jgi:predicted unusual protein kinase regulating ubiquinone biosynthesis (AarF/ABC1/UbiB family)
LVEELREQLSMELDFRHEAANAAAMAAAFAERPEVAVPPVFAALSGERVLTMQWLEGCKVRTASAALTASSWYSCLARTARTSKFCQQHSLPSML